MFLQRILPKAYDTMRLEIPECKFSVVCTLLPREFDTRYCSFMKNRVGKDAPVGVRIYCKTASNAASLEGLRSLVEEWLLTSNDTGSFGEQLVFKDVRISPYSAPETDRTYERQGFELYFSSLGPPVMWPWLLLYLRVRRDLPKRFRPSFEFFDTAIGSQHGS